MPSLFRGSGKPPMRIVGGMYDHSFVPNGNASDRRWITHSSTTPTSSTSSDSSSASSSSASLSPTSQAQLSTPEEFHIDTCHIKPVGECQEDPECLWDHGKCRERKNPEFFNIGRDDGNEEHTKEVLLNDLCQKLGCKEGQELKQCRNFGKYTPQREEQVFLSEESGSKCRKDAVRGVNFLRPMASTVAVGHFLVGIANNIFPGISPVQPGSVSRNEPSRPRGEPTMSPPKNDSVRPGHMAFRNKIRGYGPYKPS